MDKTIKLLIDDFQNQKPSAEYQLVLNKFCEAETAFISSLNKKQKAEFLKLDFVNGELGVMELREFAQFLYFYLKE